MRNPWISQFNIIHGYLFPINLKKFVIETIAGDVPAERLDKRTYRVQLNSPTVFEADKLLQVDGKEVTVDYVE
jgi:diaminopimelate epimerase